LKASGFNVLIITNVNHEPFLQKFDLEVRGVLADSEKMLQHPLMLEYMATGSYMMLNKVLQDMKEELQADFRNNVSEEYKALKAFGPRIIISTPLEFVTGAIFGRIFEVPVVTCNLQPNKPTRYLTSPLGEPAFTRTAWKVFIQVMYKDFQEKLPLARERLGQEFGDTTLWPTFAAFWEGCMNPIAPELIGFSPSLLQRPADWPKSLDPVHFTGFWVIGQKEQRRRLEQRDSQFGGDALGHLEAFVHNGERPVYVGWGSMCAGNPERMTCLAVRSLRLAGVRGIVLGGWAKLSPEHVRGQPDQQELEEYMASNVLFVDSAPHEWLFPQCAVTVHHGGAGTTAVALRSGNPTVVTPCFLDQFGNGQLVAKGGCGLRMPQFSKVTAPKLAAAIKRCLRDTAMQQRAKEMGEALQREDGLANATKVIDEFIRGDLASGAWRARFDELLRRDRVAGAPRKQCACCARRAPEATPAPRPQAAEVSPADSEPLPRVLQSSASQPEGIKPDGTRM